MNITILSFIAGCILAIGIFLAQIFPVAGAVICASAVVGILLLIMKGEYDEKN